MKKILFFAMAGMPFVTFAQKPFALEGTIAGLKNGDKIYLSYQDKTSLVLDSSIVTDNKFSFKGTLQAPIKADLTLNKLLNPRMRDFNGDRLSLYLEPSNIQLTAKDSLKNATVTGSIINDDDMKLQALLKAKNEEIDVLNANYSKLSPEEKQAQRAETVNRYYALQDQIKSMQLSFAKSNPQSFISLNVLKQLVLEDKFMLDAEKALNLLSAELKASATGIDAFKILAKAKQTAIGAYVMDFTQNDVNDTPVKLSDFKGKYVLLDFWASWCGPCRAENPNVVKAYQTYKDKNFTILGVSLDRPGKKDAWLEAIEKDGLTWTNVSDLNFWANEAAKLYGINSIPANFLIDPDGKIIAKNIRGEELQNELALILDKKTK